MKMTLDRVLLLILIALAYANIKWNQQNNEMLILLGHKTEAFDVVSRLPEGK